MGKVRFVCKVVRSTYIADDYKMYAVNVDETLFPNLKHTKYGNICIAGNIQSLIPECEYEVEATEKLGNKGYLYSVNNIKKTAIKSEQDVYMFLQETLTLDQASELYRYYPNIIELVVSGKADEVVDLSKLHGIGNYRWNIIKEKIVENYALYDLVVLFKGVLTISMLKKIYAKYTSIEQLKKELRERPYSCLCSLSRVGFRTADALLLEMEQEKIIDFGCELKTSKDRCLACILYHLEENETNGSTRMNLANLRKQVIKLTPACSDHFVACLKENTDKIYFDKKTLDIAFKETYETELNIAKYIIEAIKTKNIWNINWKSYQNVGEFPLTDEQIYSIELACKYAISILCGFGGSGKTQTTNTLIQLLLENDKTFLLCAPTGRASKVLASYTNMPTATIHRGYGYMPPNEWTYNKYNKIDKDIVIIDETSMADVNLFFRLLDGIDFERTKLFIVGDSAQLCSVGAGRVLKDLIESKIIPVATLTRIFRYGEGGLMQVATDVRNNKVFLKECTDKTVTMGKNKDYYFKQCENERVIVQCAKLYETLLKTYDASDIMVLSAQNKGDYGTVAINKTLQKIANKNYGSSENYVMKDDVYYEGDIVIQTKNNYNAMLYDLEKCEIVRIPDPKIKDEIVMIPVKTLIANGESGKIVKLIEDENYKVTSMVIDFDGTIVLYQKKDVETISLGYCISVHKSQGGSAKIVIFLTPSSHQFMLNANLLYVGLTRTKERCFHIGDLKTINRAIKKEETKSRSTFLLGMLTNGVN